VAQPLLDDFEVRSGSQQVCGMAMPQVVEANAPNLSTLYDPPEVSLDDVMRMNWFAVGLTEHSRMLASRPSRDRSLARTVRPDQLRGIWRTG